MNGTWHLEILSPDGKVARRVDLSGPELELGRRGRGLAFADDVQMADRHARLRVSERGVELIDSGGGSGVWLRQRGSDGRSLGAGDQIWLGAQILVVVEDHGRWRLRHHGSDGRFVAVHEIPEAGFFIGRDSELVLDSFDRALSRRHAQIVLDDGIPRFYDRGAHNGSFLKLTGVELLDAGAEFRVSTQQIRLVKGSTADSQVSSRPRPSPDAVPEAPSARVVKRRGDRPPSLASRLRALGSARDRREAPNRPKGATAPIQADEGVEALRIPLGEKGKPDRSDLETTPSRVASGSETPVAEPLAEDAALELSRLAQARPPAPTGRARDDVPTEGVLLVIDSKDGSVTLETQAGKTVLEAVREAGLERGSPVDWECGDGGCGVCVLGVVEGAQRMDPPDPETGEMKTIQITEQVVPDPNKFRLACLARVRGTVRLRKLD